MSGTARSGRKPQPTALKILRGNPGRRKLNDREPRGDPLPECPAHLAGKSRQAWHDFAGAFGGIATSLDSTALELLASSYAAYLEALAGVVAGGPVWIEKTQPGKLPRCRISPYQKVANHAWRQVKELLIEFGATPSSRSRVQVAGPAAAGDGFDDFLKGRG